MNKIILKNEQILPLFAWRDKNIDLLQQFHPFLWNFEINVEESQKISAKITYNADIEEYHITLEYYINASNEFNKIFTADLTSCQGTNKYHTKIKWNNLENLNHTCTEILEIMLNSPADNENKTTKQEIIEDNIGLFFATNAYFFHYKKNTQLLPIKFVEKHIEYKHGKYKTINITKLENQYTIIGRVRYNKILKQHQWHIDCWDVRGHERHYKNGKIIFIKPYQKGKNKNNKETSKIYKIN